MRLTQVLCNTGSRICAKQKKYYFAPAIEGAAEHEIPVLHKASLRCMQPFSHPQVSRVKLSEINNHLLSKISQSQIDENEELMEPMNTIEDLCSDHSKLITRIDLPIYEEDLDNDDLKNEILLSTIFSDTTRLCSNSNQGTYQKTEEYYLEELEELLSYYNLIDEQRKILTVTAGTLNFTNIEAVFLIENFKPLIECDRLTISPNWNLFIATGTEDDPVFCTIPTERDKRNNVWRAPLTGPNQSSIPLNYIDPSDPKHELSKELTIPFIAGLNVEDFTKVIEDEKDLLSGLRKELKTFTQSKPDESKIKEEIYQDLIRPRIDKISQKFKAISNIHKLKVRGTVFATAALSLLSLSFGQYLAAATQMLSVATGSAGLVKFEAEYQTDMENLKSDPMYLLWKLGQLRKH